MVSKLIQIAVQDTLTRHKSTGEPLDRIIANISRKRTLGARDRKILADEAFAELRKKPWPEWFSKRISKPLEESLRTRSKPVLAVDTRKMSIFDASEHLASQGITCLRSELANTALILSTDRVDLSKLKACWWMDEGSQYIAAQVKAQSGESVLDLCAGSGNKARLILATGAKVTMVDRHDKRMAHLEGVRRIVTDGRTFSSKILYDWILVDAPCSGTGTLRHAPDLFGRLKESDIANYVQLQRELVANATKLLKPSGYLIYATCSLLAEENHRHFDGLTLIHHRQLLPNQDGCDGFYTALFRLETNNVSNIASCSI